jgi:YfiH family protein
MVAGMYATGDLGEGVRWAFSDRQGGVSAGPYASCNLSRHVGDSEDAVARNRGSVLASLTAAPIAWIQACHGSNVAMVEGPNDTPENEPAPVVDGIVTTVPGLALGVLAADCALVLLAGAHGRDRFIGAAHCGRPGLSAGIVPAIVRAMRELGAEELRAVVGPTICAACYEVSAELRDEAAAAVPQAWEVTPAGRPAVDLAAGVRAQLRDVDVGKVRVVEGCTAEDGRLYSYRRDGRTGRHGGFIWIDQ